MKCKVLSPVLGNNKHGGQKHRFGSQIEEFLIPHSLWGKLKDHEFYLLNGVLMFLTLED